MSDHHDYDALDDEQQAALDSIEWLQAEADIRMGCGCVCTIRPGDILWVWEPGPHDPRPAMPIAISRGTIH